MNAPFAAQRTKGSIDLRFSAEADTTQVMKAFQSGAGRVRFPRSGDTEQLQAMLINTAGGLTGGDEFLQSVRLEDGAEAVVTSQAFEKFYRSSGPRTSIETRLSIASKATLLWLPQPGIFFNSANLGRYTEVSCTADSSFIALESMIFGRTRMGEIVRSGMLKDQMRLIRDGKLVFADTFFARGDLDRTFQSVGTLRGSKAYATVIAQCSENEQILERLALVNAQSNQSMSGSCVNGIVVIKMLAESGLSLSRLVGACLSEVFAVKLPRIWQI